MSCDDFAQSLPGVPGSVRSVASKLCEHERMTMKDLQEASGLARRTVYGAVQRLRDLGMVEERPNLFDTRQNWYSLR